MPRYHVAFFVCTESDDVNEATLNEYQFTVGEAITDALFGLGITEASVSSHNIWVEAS